MCGRYAASRHQDQLVEVFEVDEVVPPAADDPRPWTQSRYNIAPTDTVAAVVERAAKDADETTRKLVGLRWGLVPSWSKDATGAARLINARLETVAEKPSFRKAIRARRCLIPADGYYEWYATAAPKTPKQPFWIHPAAPGPMVMAGIYEFWRDPAVDSDDPHAWLSSCSILTTNATDDLGMIHDRMPVQVPRDNWNAWLDPALTDAETALSLTHVPSAGEMTAHAVSRLVSNVRNDGPALIEPLPFDDLPEDFR